MTQRRRRRRGQYEDTAAPVNWEERRRGRRIQVLRQTNTAQHLRNSTHKPGFVDSLILKKCLRCCSFPLSMHAIVNVQVKQASQTLMFVGWIWFSWLLQRSYILTTQKHSNTIRRETTADVYSSPNYVLAYVTCSNFGPPSHSYAYVSD